ncbi:MAG: hypothetical protein WBD99_04545 [Thermodesulfobacteriota bacterium]
MIYGMRELTLYMIIAALITSLLSVSIMAEEDDLEFQRKYNKQDNPISLWYFQISAPSKRTDYPPSFLWYTGRPYMDSTLTPIFGNQIYIRKDTEE